METIGSFSQIGNTREKITRDNANKILLTTLISVISAGSGLSPRIFAGDGCHRQALLVQQTPQFREDIKTMQGILEKRRYKTKIIDVEECTRDNVLSNIEQLAIKSRENSKSLFYYGGHGDERYGYVNGITMNGGEPGRGPWAQRMVP